jgi:hypothetical protein
MLGLKARDRVTGFSGVISSVSFDLYGCVLIILTPGVGADGKRGDPEWFDLKRLEVTEPTPVMPQPVFAVAGTEKGPSERPRSMPHT